MPQAHHGLVQRVQGGDGHQVRVGADLVVDLHNVHLLSGLGTQADLNGTETHTRDS